MRTTITEEFEDGHLVRRTTVTEGEPPLFDFTPTVGDAPAGCRCGQPWHSILPPPPCPVHRPAWPGSTITINADTTKTPREIAVEVGRQLRSMS